MFIFRPIIYVIVVWFMGICVVVNRTVQKRSKRIFLQGTVRATRRRKYYKGDPGPGRGAAPPEALQVPSAQDNASAVGIRTPVSNTH